VPRERIVPFLTTKHPLPYCLSYADRARQSGFPALVVLGGDKAVGTPRSVAHAWQLRQMLRERDRTLILGGWANPHGDPERQADFVASPDFHAEFFLTQVVSHYDAARVTRFVETLERRRIAVPGVFGVFFYRSANPRTLSALQSFLPVPVEGLTEAFAAGQTPEQVCATTLRTLLDAGARHFYISNLPIARAQAALAEIFERAGL
jgi:5,10-methylenetetrahydrofolate reductase